MGENRQGDCVLCLQNRELRRSHFLGRAIQRLNGRDQVIMTRQLIAPTQKQLRRHLLCGECEGRFGNRESYALSLLQRKVEADFRLLNWINLAMPIGGDSELAVYSALTLGVDTVRLAYFALSVIWRSSVGPWPTLGMQATSVRSLGDFQEPVRKYLLGETAFPGGIAIILWVCTDYGSRFMTFAPYRNRRSGLPTYSLLTRGLWFHAVMSNTMPPSLLERCCVNSEKRVMFRRNCERESRHANEQLMATAVEHPSLQQSSASLI